MTVARPPVRTVDAPTAPAPPTSPAPAATPARVAATLAAVVALVGAVLGPTGQFDGLLGSRVAVASGVVELLDGETWRPAPVGSRLATGSTVRAPDGTATLDVAGGAVDLAEGTRLVVDEPLTVRSGSLVVRSDAVTAGEGVVTATGEGPWRFDATGRVGAYGGAPVLTDAAGRETLVRSYEEARVADGVVQGAPRPYVYVGSDPFDRQHLASAIDVDTYVASLRRGLTVDYGRAPQPPAFYTDFVGFDVPLVTALEDIGFARDGNRVGPPADVLVAAVFIDALVADTGLTADEASDEVRTKRLAGATWGLIAQARDLDAANVRSAADRALALRQQAEAEGTATPPVGGAESAEPTPTPADEGGTSPDDDDGPTTGSDQPGPGAEEDAPTTPGASEEPAGPVGDIVEDTGAEELLPDPLDETVDRTGDVVDDVLAPLPDPLDETVVRTGEVVDEVLGSLTEQPSAAATDREDDTLVGTTGRVVDETAEAVGDTVGGLLGGD